jgi:predicted dehydrogenase
MTLTRREFLHRSTTAAAAVSLPMFVTSHVFGANDEIRLAVIGCGVRSGTHIAEFGPQKGVRIAAVCDPDQVRSASTAKSIAKRFSHKPDTVADVRKLMERKDLDAVSIATMQYWHALPTIWACQTGRHVYVEKPLSHFIWEGRQMVHAVRKYRRLVQVGLQNRSILGWAAMAEWLREGHLGKIQYVTCFANKPRRSIGRRAEPLPIPPTLDYELWCGPAQKGPIYRDKIQYDCSFTWNMGDGESCNQGVHEIDVARWILGYTGLPRRVMSIGGRFVFNDAGDVPNTQIICYDYSPRPPILYELHNLPKSKACMTPETWSTQPDFKGAKVGVCVQCEGGYTLQTAAYDARGKQLRKFGPAENHFVNFINALRSGKQADLHAEIEEGQRSTAICHAGNISYRLGHPAPLDQQRKQLGEMACWRDMHERYVKYLGDIDVDPDSSTLGPWLECDPAHECFKDNAEANRLVKGSYREPFVMPDLGGSAGQTTGAAAAFCGYTATTSKGKIHVAQLANPQQFAQMKQAIEEDNPDIRFSLVEVDGEATLRAEQGGMRVFWLYRGQGEVFLPKGYRTQEGDGKPLPAFYKPDQPDAPFVDAIRLMKTRLGSVSPGATVAVKAIVGRLRNEGFVGNFAGDLWTLEHASRPWSADAQVEAALSSLFRVYRQQGFSTKQIDSFEPLMEGDQLIACGNDAVRVRGRFCCLAMENVKRTASHESTARRLRYLLGTAGGCNPDFDPFRRLPLTWYINYPGESGDGVNWVNSHVVNIPKETSPTHFHPPKAIGGGTTQREMYLVLGPAAYKLNTWGRKASLILYPDLHDLRRFEQHPLEPGDFVYIPPGTGHRGLDVFVNVLTLPGFKPHNEYYIDRDIHDLAGGKSPYNANLLKAKNYQNIEDLL